jgi:hypothetical protein
MGQAQCSETSAIKHQTLENNPKDYTQNTETMSDIILHNEESLWRQRDTAEGLELNQGTH